MKKQNETNDITPMNSIKNFKNFSKRYLLLVSKVLQ